jgi:hypothetical protein
MIRFSNFTMMGETTGASKGIQRYIMARVIITETSGIWPFRRDKVTRRDIARTSGICDPWLFVDTGCCTPDFEVKALERSWRTKNRHTV